MSKAYLATVVAVFVTVSLATNLLVVTARGSAAPRLSARLRAGMNRLRRRLKHFIDERVAAMLARRAGRAWTPGRHAGLSTLGADQRRLP